MLNFFFTVPFLLDEENASLSASGGIKLGRFQVTALADYTQCKVGINISWMHVIYSRT